MTNPKTMMHEAYTPGYSANATAFMALRSAETHAAFFLSYLRAGMSLLDCGCGPGAITLGLARRLAPGRVVGIDQAPSQLAFARDQAASRGISNIEFRKANIYALPFAHHTFDAVFSHALIEHLAEPVKALREIRRVLKPGCVAGICSPDWRGFIIAPETPALNEAIAYYKRLQIENGGDVAAGGKLGVHMTSAGFKDVQMHARYECYPDRRLIGEYLAKRIETVALENGTVAQDQANPPEPARMAAALRKWQTDPHGLFAQAWVSAIGRA